RYRTSLEMDQKLSGMGEFETHMKMGQVIRQKVESISPEGLAEIECTWEAMRLHTSLPMGDDVDFDSTRGDSGAGLPESFAGLPKLVGLVFHMRMKSTGEVVDVTGIADAVDKLLEGHDSKKSPMRQVMNSMLSDESMKRMLQVTALPEKALTVGDDWTRDVEVPMGPIGKAKARYDYTLEGLE